MQESLDMLNLLTRGYDLIPSTFANETGVNIISKLFEGPIDPLIAIYEQLATFSQSVKFTEPNTVVMTTTDKRLWVTSQAWDQLRTTL